MDTFVGYCGAALHRWYLMVLASAQLGARPEVKSLARSSVRPAPASEQGDAEANAAGLSCCGRRGIDERSVPCSIRRQGAGAFDADEAVCGGFRRFIECMIVP